MFRVVPLCSRQLRDVDASDILEGGLYRKCRTYKSGGGYDRFPEYAERFLGIEGDSVSEQFIVQLWGCNLACPYCYVTQEGIWGDYVTKTAEDLLNSFISSGLNVFHLMGGAPALYLDKWESIVEKLPDGAVFHSDMLLTEQDYDLNTLKSLSKYSDRLLLAVNVKGIDPDSYLVNTGREMDVDRFERNLELLNLSGVPYYVTFTGIPHYEEYARRYFSDKLDAGLVYNIELVDYDALKEV